MKNVMLTTILTFALLASCSENGFVSILPADCRLKAGDLVFRRGNGLASHAVLMVDKRGGYSHVGIVVDSCGTMMVVHAVPDEPDFEGDVDRVKMETPEKFFLSMNAKIGEVKRLKGDTATAIRAARHAMEIYRRGTLFDHNYDDTDTTRMYCCELIEHVYKTDSRQHKTRHNSAGHEAQVHTAVRPLRQREIRAYNLFLIITLLTI